MSHCKSRCKESINQIYRQQIQPKWPLHWHVTAMSVYRLAIFTMCVSDFISDHNFLVFKATSTLTSSSVSELYIHREKARGKAGLAIGEGLKIVCEGLKTQTGWYLLSLRCRRIFVWSLTDNQFRRNNRKRGKWLDVEPLIFIVKFQLKRKKKFKTTWSTAIECLELRETVLLNYIFV